MFEGEFTAVGVAMPARNADHLHIEIMPVFLDHLGCVRVPLPGTVAKSELAQHSTCDGETWLCHLCTQCTNIRCCLTLRP